LQLDPATWRLLVMKPASGAWNMAVDEAILNAVGKGSVPPTLRLYAWNPPCLSLGFAQPVSEVDLAVLEEKDWELVRRPTGGRAILHTDELTYSVIGPGQEPRLAGSVLESYRRLAQGLLAALSCLGLQASAEDRYTLPVGTDPAGPVCFEVPSNYEITVRGKKLIGSAQARRRDGVLQHGSLPLTGDLTRITQALVFPDEEAREEAARRLLARAATVETVLARQVSWEEAAESFAAGFSKALNLRLESSELTPGEQERALELLHRKYRSKEWTEKV